MDSKFLEMPVPENPGKVKKERKRKLNLKKVEAMLKNLRKGVDDGLLLVTTILKLMLLLSTRAVRPTAFAALRRESKALLISKDISSSRYKSTDDKSQNALEDASTSNLVIKMNKGILAIVVKKKMVARLFKEHPLLKVSDLILTKSEMLLILVV